MSCCLVILLSYVLIQKVSLPSCVDIVYLVPYRDVLGLLGQDGFNQFSHDFVFVADESGVSKEVAERLWSDGLILLLHIILPIDITGAIIGWKAICAWGVNPH